MLTTLVVEYAAKPHLEARKERILTEHRERRTLSRSIGELAFCCGRISAFFDESIPKPKNATESELAEKHIRRLSEEAVRLIDEIRPLIRTADSQTDDLLHDTLPVIGAFAEGLPPAIQRIGIDQVLTNPWELFDDAGSSLDQLAELVELPRWRFRQRAQIVSSVLGIAKNVQIIRDSELGRPSRRDAGE
ncbi:hypothetical protein GCM10009841_08210 [Microlunatus panaciterrae]|uniref:Uncharacterized protein n=1 Tax=Microlunatus panaciterrae TaxID=400768 RepID=A0ABS2RK62_9ACTN|nr:hypothetical protein [Microlunatus panaciterrae]